MGKVVRSKHLETFPIFNNMLHNINKVREMHTLLLFMFVVWTPPFFHFLQKKKINKGDNEDLIEMINNLRAKSKYDNSLGTNYVPLTKKKKEKERNTHCVKKNKDR